MAKKVEITEKQLHQFNHMLHMLKRITQYQSPAQLRKNSNKDWGLDYEESLEMSYENMQSEAKVGCKNIRPIK